MDRQRHRQSGAEQEVLKALDILERRHGVKPFQEPATTHEKAHNRLMNALLHVREVSFGWDRKARGLVTEARDLLRGHYQKPEHVNAVKDELGHCENAVKALERSTLLSRVSKGLRQRREKKPDRQKDHGRERE